MKRSILFVALLGFFVQTEGFLIGYQLKQESDDVSVTSMDKSLQNSEKSVFQNLYYDGLHPLIWLPSFLPSRNNGKPSQKEINSREGLNLPAIQRKLYRNFQIQV